MKKKVAFYIESMVVGGAEKVLIDLVNNLNPTKFEVTVIALFKKSIYSDYCFQFEEGFKNHVNYKYLIDNTNEYKYLLFNYLYAHLPKSWMYRYLIKDKYDIEVAFYEGWPTDFVSFSIQDSYKIAWLHTDQGRLYKENSRERLNEKREIYNSYNKLVGVSNSVCQSFIIKFPGSEVQCVYNPIHNESIIEKADKEIVNRNEIPQFVTVGRLIPIKGYERLILALEQCKRQGYKFGLWMIGDGEKREELKALVEKHNLKNEIEFLGQKSNPYPYLKSADCLICSSYSEGLSTVAIESIVLGKPVITTSCSGMEEIFGGFSCGHICENSIEGLINSIKDILENPQLLKKFSAQSKQRGEFFALNNRMAVVEELLEKAII